LPQDEDEIELVDRESYVMTTRDAASLVAYSGWGVFDAAKLCGCKPADVERALRVNGHFPPFVPTPDQIRESCKQFRDDEEKRRWADTPQSRREIYEYGSV